MQLKPGFLFVLMNPAKLGKLGSWTQLTWVTCSLGSPGLPGFWTQLKPRFSLGWTQLSIPGMNGGMIMLVIILLKCGVWEKGGINILSHNVIIYIQFRTKCWIAQKSRSRIFVRIGLFKRIGRICYCGLFYFHEVGRHWTIFDVFCK